MVAFARDTGACDVAGASMDDNAGFDARCGVRTGSRLCEYFGFFVGGHFLLFGCSGEGVEAEHEYCSDKPSLVRRALA